VWRARRQAPLQSRHRLTQPLGSRRLQHVVARRALERGNGELVVRRDEHAQRLGTSGGIATGLASPALNDFPYGSLLLRCGGLVVALALCVMEFRGVRRRRRVHDAGAARRGPLTPPRQRRC